MLIALVLVLVLAFFADVVLDLDLLEVLSFVFFGCLMEWDRLVGFLVDFGGGFLFLDTIFEDLPGLVFDWVLEVEEVEETVLAFFGRFCCSFSVVNFLFWGIVWSRREQRSRGKKRRIGLENHEQVTRKCQVGRETKTCYS